MIYLACDYTIVGRDGAQSEALVSIDLNKGTVEQNGEIFPSRYVTISPTLVTFEKPGNMYGEGITYQISREDLSYGGRYKATFTAGQCELSEAPKRAF